jgi:hypothetical protein
MYVRLNIRYVCHLGNDLLELLSSTHLKLLTKDALTLIMARELSANIILTFLPTTAFNPLRA